MTFRSKVSVIVPNYNHSEYLEERLKTILDQTVPPDELIFIDDASQDDSVKIAKQILESYTIPHRIIINEENSGSVFRQWLKGIDLAIYDLVWIAESDDSVDKNFLYHIKPLFQREDVMAAYGHISYIEPSGKSLTFLDTYYDGLKFASWERTQIISAYKLFSWDFSIKNIVPNVSGMVFVKPILSDKERIRLLNYKFAGDWYLYSLILRGGSLAYHREAKSYFRLLRTSVSHKLFETDLHLKEHRMIIEHLTLEYGISRDVVRAHQKEILKNFPRYTQLQIETGIPVFESHTDVIKICIGAMNFSIGGGEVLPIILANSLKDLGHHVTYLVAKRNESSEKTVRHRLRRDIPVFYLPEIHDLLSFMDHSGFDVISSHCCVLEWEIYNRRVPFKCPYIPTLHGSYEASPDICCNKGFGNYIRNKISKCLYTADKNKAPLLNIGIPEKNFIKVFNTVPDVNTTLINRETFRATHQIPVNAFVILLCSRALPSKGWDIGIEMMKNISNTSERPLYMVLIGDGPYLSEAQRLAKNMTNVLFLGALENASIYFHCCDLGILPTTFSGESFPLVILEYFRARLPVITTDIGDIPNMLVDEPGIILNHQLTKAELVEEVGQCILHLMNDPLSYTKMCENTEIASNRFGKAKFAQQYISTIKNLNPNKFELIPRVITI